MGELVITNLEAWYGSVQALHGVNIRVAEGECVAILGPNGAGKTTLLRAISRLLPFSGEVRLDGALVTGQPDDVVRQGIAHVLEGRHIFAGLSVRENLLLAQFGSSGGDFKGRYEAVLDFFPILRPKLKSLGGQLSGGQQQILAIARGLLCAPKVLLMDEPSLGLAPVVVEQLASAIPRIRSEWKATIVLSEQLVQLALIVADRIYVLVRGRVMYSGPADTTILADTVVSGYLGQAAVRPEEGTRHSSVGHKGGS